MKLNKFPTLLILAVMALVMTSCEKEYWDASDKSGMKCVFQQEAASFDIPTEEITITLKRSSTEGELTVYLYPEDFVVTVGNYVYEQEDIYEWFYFPESVTFADGSETAQYTISAIGSYHDSGYEYNFTMVIDNEFRSAGDEGCAVSVEVI